MYFAQGDATGRENFPSADGGKISGRNTVERRRDEETSSPALLSTSKNADREALRGFTAKTNPLVRFNG